MTAVGGLAIFTDMAYAFAFKAEGRAARHRQQTIPCLVFLRVAYLKQVGDYAEFLAAVQMVLQTQAKISGYFVSLGPLAKNNEWCLRVDSKF